MLKRVALGLGVVGAGVLAWSSLVETNRFVLREHTLPVLPAGHRPVRVLHLSDLHMAPWQRRKQAWIAGLGALRPDLIVGTGDFLGHHDGIDGVKHALEPFRGIPGVFVNGSNDTHAPEFKNPLRYFAGPSKTSKTVQLLDTDSLMQMYADLGWVDLNNHAASIAINGTTVNFIGVDDAHKRWDRLDDATDELAELAPADLVIGVTHAPYQRVLNGFGTRDADVIFAGHTHGGQVCLPEFAGGTLVTNCDIPRDQARGLSRWNNGAKSAALNVSAGLGTSIFAPVRLFCRPEAVLITLIPAS